MDIALTYAHIDGVATTPGQPETQLPSAVPDSAGLITRYNFKSGRAKGLTIGAGARWVGGDVEFFLPGADRSALNQKDPYVLLDVFARYRKKVFGLETDFSFNAKNLTDELYIDRSIEIGQPRSYEFTVGVQF